MSTTLTRSAFVVLAAVTLQVGVASAQVLSFTENLEFDRPEAWAMKYFTSLSLLTEFGAPADLPPAGVELGFEGGWVPTLSPAERQVGFEGTKVEDLNRTSVIGRLRVAVGLPRHYRITFGYTPPVRLSGVKPNLFSISVGKVIRAQRTWGLGIRLSGQVGYTEGDLTCTALQSGRSGLGAWLGMVVATAAKLAVVFLMIGLVIFKLSRAQVA